jgi:hypothetical protein
MTVEGERWKVQAMDDHISKEVDVRKEAVDD